MKSGTLRTVSDFLHVQVSKAATTVSRFCGTLTDVAGKQSSQKQYGPKYRKLI